MDSLQSAKNGGVRYFGGNTLFAASSGRGGIQTCRGNLPAGAGARRFRSQQTIFYIAGYHQRDDDLRSLPVSVYSVAERGNSEGRRVGSRFQSFGEPALRVHAVRDLSPPAAGKPATYCIAGGRAALSRLMCTNDDTEPTF